VSIKATGIELTQANRIAIVDEMEVALAIFRVRREQRERREQQTAQAQVEEQQQ
jgi:hypothetical protein